MVKLKDGEYTSVNRNNRQMVCLECEKELIKTEDEQLQKASSATQVRGRGSPDVGMEQTQAPDTPMPDAAASTGTGSSLPDSSNVAGANQAATSA